MVNVDTVYQTVQALANKEQRGYLTPQEFNLFAIQAQTDIFEQYFYDINAFRLRGVQLGTGEEFEIGDSTTMIREKIKRTGNVTYTSQMNLIHDPGGIPGAGHWQFPPGRNGKLYARTGRKRRTLRMIDDSEFNHMKNSRFHRDTAGEWYVFDEGYGRIYIEDLKSNPIAPVGARNFVTCENVQGKPGLVYWGYTIVNEKALYNPAASKNFELVREEQPDLVIKILKLAGVSIEDPQLAGIAAQEEQLNLQQENK